MRFVDDRGAVEAIDAALDLLRIAQEGLMQPGEHGPVQGGPVALLGGLMDSLDGLRNVIETMAGAGRVLLFADGLAVSNTGYALADLYAEDYAPAQDVLAEAGCWGRGIMRNPDGPTYPRRDDDASQVAASAITHAVPDPAGELAALDQLVNVDRLRGSRFRPDPPAPGS